MTPGARLSAAIEVIAEIEARRRPAADALKDWGLAHRFAGSGDRAAIAGLVYDALRRRASSALSWAMRARAPCVLGMLRLERKLDAAAIARLADGARFAPAAAERRRARPARWRQASTARRRAIAGDYPEWLDPHLARTFGEERAAEGAALASRAPLDLRVNTLKSERDKAAAALADLDPQPTRWSPVGLRITLAADAKSPAVHAEPAFIKGMVEVQDEGSQIAALLHGRQTGRAGGRSLRRRRRQDAGAGGGDGKSRPDLRDRSRQATARADPRTARACRRSQRAGPHAEIHRQRARRSPRPHGPGADRRALHRHRRLAAQSRRQMAGAARRARRALEGAGSGARPRRRAREAGRPHRLCHLLGACRGERRSGARFPRAAAGLRRARRRQRWRTRSASVPTCSAAPC